jgi:hypothetical protein
MSHMIEPFKTHCSRCGREVEFRAETSVDLMAKVSDWQRLIGALCGPCWKVEHPEVKELVRK